MVLSLDGEAAAVVAALRVGLLAAFELDSFQDSIEDRLRSER